MTIRWGLIGVGRLSRHLGPAFAGARRGRLVACASRRYEAAAEFAGQYGVDRVHHSYQDLLKDPGVDAVFVATPNHLHHEVVLAAAAAGKHVLCEKPMAPTVREAEEMVAACDAAGVVLRVGFHLRFLRVVQAAAGAVREGRLGTLREVTAQRISAQPKELVAWRQDLGLAKAGVLADVGVHVIDQVQWVVGQRINRVFAFTYPDRATQRPDDSATVLLEFDGGCLATVRCSRGLPMGSNDLQAFGTQGMLQTGPLRWVDSYHLTVRDASRTDEQDFPLENPYSEEIDAFDDAVAGRPSPAATGREGIESVRILDAIIQSLETGAAVVLGTLSKPSDLAHGE